MTNNIIVPYVHQYFLQRLKNGSSYFPAGLTAAELFSAERSGGC